MSHLWESVLFSEMNSQAGPLRLFLCKCGISFHPKRKRRQDQRTGKAEDIPAPAQRSQTLGYTFWIPSALGHGGRGWGNTPDWGCFEAHGVWGCYIRPFPFTVTPSRPQFRFRVPFPIWKGMSHTRYGRLQSALGTT